MTPISLCENTACKFSKPSKCDPWLGITCTASMKASLPGWNAWSTSRRTNTGGIPKSRTKRRWSEWVREFSSSFRCEQKLISTRREPRCVVHFYHSRFKRCEIMDKHLTVRFFCPLLAPHLKTLIETSPKISKHSIFSRLCRKHSLACRKTRH